MNDLAGLAERTDEQRAEIDRLAKELGDAEAGYRAAVLAEDEAAAKRAKDSGETAERDGLLREARLGVFLTAAAEGRAVHEGRELELNQAYGITDGSFPVDLLRAEHRADVAITSPATAGVPQNQREPLARVFPDGASAFLRVQMPTVPVGTASYPVFSTGASGGIQERGDAQDSEAAAFTSNILTPTRASAAYLFSIEEPLGWQKRASWAKLGGEMKSPKRELRAFRAKTREE